MAKGLTAIGQNSINMGYVYVLRTKTKVDVAIAQRKDNGWVWTFYGVVNEHKADSLEQCIYQAEEALGIPHEEKTVPSTLKRVKVGDQSYELRDRVTGDLVGTAVKTGTHRDNYPWNWSIEGQEDVGVADSLKACVEAVETKRSK